MGNARGQWEAATRDWKPGVQSRGGREGRDGYRFWMGLQKGKGGRRLQLRGQGKKGSRSAKGVVGGWRRIDSKGGAEGEDGKGGAETAAQWYPHSNPTSATCPGMGSAGSAQAAVMSRPRKQKWVRVTAPKRPRAPTPPTGPRVPLSPPPPPGHGGEHLQHSGGISFSRVCSRPANRWRRRCRPVPAKPVGAAPSRRRVSPLPSRNLIPSGHSPARPPRQTGCASWKAGRGSLKRDNNIICIFLLTEENQTRRRRPSGGRTAPTAALLPSRPTRPRRGLQPRVGPAVR